MMTKYYMVYFLNLEKNNLNKICIQMFTLSSFGLGEGGGGVSKLKLQNLNF